MKQEKSCGCIIIEENKVLLVKHQKGHWDFPKGHIEENETEIMTAIREVKEETNLDVEIKEKKRYEVEYITDKGNLKKVVYFLAKRVSGEILAQESEISQIEWISFEDAYDKITYNTSKELWNQIYKELIYKKKENKPKLYLITGPSGVGKSTISKRLAKSREKSALIEGDYIYSQVIGSYVSAWKEGNHLKVFWKICLDTIQIYLENGYDVVFNYIITPDIFEKIKEKFKNYETKFVVMVVSEEVLLKRDKNRPIDCQMNERCLILLNNFKNHNYGADYFLDTTELSIDETVKVIENHKKFLIKKN